jgi:hypothetical protein
MVTVKVEAKDKKDNPKLQIAFAFIGLSRGFAASF